ncbi:MAG TPA: hypothetical protein VMM56_10340 [Planctomycetaceae bacterium]|nr:hypothetical protein [Planctomycetaceae bacterium]
MITSSPQIVLARYGAISEVARFRWLLDCEPQRGQRVVVKSHRGEMLGTVLERVEAAHDPHAENEVDFKVVRLPNAEDERRAIELQRRASDEYGDWLGRIAEWNIDLQLIDLERTLDGEKLILYVLCDRGPESTKLALHAAAGGLGIVEVQPVDREGLVVIPSSGGGCGSGGCGSGGCASH